MSRSRCSAMGAHPMLTRWPHDAARIGICAALERARWTVWDTEALPARRATTSTRSRPPAGSRSCCRPIRSRLERAPTSVLDILDGLILAGGADIDPATYGEPRARGDRRHAARARRLRDRAGAARRSSATCPLLGICRGMQLMNVARGRHARSSTCPTTSATRTTGACSGSFDGADHDVRLAGGSLAARAAGEVDHADQVPPPPGRRPRWARGSSPTGWSDARRAARGDRGPGPALRARRAVASRGGSELAA